METISVNGHDVPAAEADRFFNGRDGSPLTDEQWDEDKRRRENAPQDEDEHLWTPVGGDEE